MNAFTSLPHRFAWSAQQLADAMPRRLSESSIFQHYAPDPLPQRRGARRRFLPDAHTLLFRVR